jgi:hypothetical protein
MTVSLALLKKYSQPGVIAETETGAVFPHLNLPDLPFGTQKAEKKAAPTRKMSFPRPPAHIFAVNSSADSLAEQNAFKDRGKISE